MLRVEPAVFGAPRTALLEGLRAAGVPCSSGYGYALPDQPLFRNKAFGPYLPQAAAALDYGAVRCPNADLLCREQAVWLEQALFLGTDADIDAIGDAFEGVPRR